jgi:hypothetical protein
MTLFVRLSRGGNWDTVQDNPGDLSFPADVIADFLDAEGQVSLWKLADDLGKLERDPSKTTDALYLSEDVQRISAALHRSDVNTLHPVTLRVISN